MTRRSLVFRVICLSLFACGLSAAAQAVTLSRTQYRNGGSACTGALPTFEGALRKRPKAIANEGTTVAFISCSAEANDENTATPYLAFVAATNRGAAAADLSCTLVNGDEVNGSTAFPKTVSLPVNVVTTIFWTPAGGASNFDEYSINVSCALQPGMEVDIFGQSHDEDIGD